MTNDAAERLLKKACTCQAFPGVYPHKDFCVIDQALADERRATVERIRAALATYERKWHSGPSGYFLFSGDILAILDAEAER